MPEAASRQAYSECIAAGNTQFLRKTHFRVSSINMADLLTHFRAPGA